MDKEYFNTDEYFKDMLMDVGLLEDEAERMIEDFYQDNWGL